MARGLYLLFGAFAYVLFLATFLYLIAFVGNLPGVPRTVDRGLASELVPALLVDLALIALFGAPAQPSWPGRASSGDGRGSCRSPRVGALDVPFSNLALILLFLFWRPLPQIVWDAGDGLGAALLLGAVRGGLGHRVAEHLPDQPFRIVRG